MTSKEIRDSFIQFFKDKEHTFVPSSPVVPADDPTLLFTNAGMNQFKDILLGKGTRNYSRAVNSQKCIRVSGKHNDLEEVGHDTYHHTFFEMLGNWSFGDYYKKEAIQWAWELMTSIWKLPKDKLYATVFRDDDEAAELWTRLTDIAPDHVLRFDEKDNFWEMGETGPCGPCSEIHIDQGPDKCDHQGEKHTCFVNGDCGRYIELWNLVFIQYNRDTDGSLSPLPAKHVDTGAGFERLVAVLQNKSSNYDTDVFMPLLNRIGELTGIPYEKSKEKMAFRVIADHVRMLSFSIADGGLPSNAGRGYVMRRILRRASRYARKLDVHDPIIFKLVDTVVETLGGVFPELIERKNHIANVIRAEEEHFNRSLDRGLEIFDKIIAGLKENNIKTVPGTDVFRLYDTYGFPVDLTRILAEEAGFSVDSKGFDQEMDQQKKRARNAAKFKSADIATDEWIILSKAAKTRFNGYSKDRIETEIIRYAVNSGNLHIVLAETPFYSESGGQVGDKGQISNADFAVDVLDTQKSGDDIIHICSLPEGFELKNNMVIAEITRLERRQTEKNHTATHLLHAALRQVLGAHVQQAGSLVDTDRLRFDFTHHGKLSDTEVQQIEDIVNQKIIEDIALTIAEDYYDNAKKRGAMALFGEKYEDTVRTVQIGNFSLELCGGTHVKQTGVIGPFIITYEGSVAAGVRRIEALTGQGAVQYLRSVRTGMKKVAELLSAREDDIVSKTADLIEKRRQAEKELSKLTSKMVSDGLEGLLDGAEEIHGIKVLIHEMADAGMDQLKELADRIREKTTGTVAVLGARSGEKIHFVCAVTDDLVSSKKLNAGELVRKIAAVAEGGGGGRPHLATAGGKNPAKFDQAMQEIKKLL